MLTNGPYCKVLPQKPSQL